MPKRDRAAKVLSDHPAVSTVEPRSENLRVTLRPEIAEYSHLVNDLVSSGFKLRTFSEEELNLETAFMVLTKGITS